MPPLPPLQDVLDVLRAIAFPATAGAALVTVLLLGCGRWAAALASAAGVVAGFVWANGSFQAVEWRNAFVVIPWVAEPADPAWFRLPKAGLFLIGVGLLSRWVGIGTHYIVGKRWWWAGALFTWAARAGAAGVIGPGLVPEYADGAAVWLRPLFVVVMLLHWVALDGVARERAGSEVAAYLGAAFLAAGAVLVYAHSARMMDVAVMCGCAAVGVAVAAFPTRADASGLVPVGVLALPGLMLNGHYQTFSAVPVTSFCLVGVAPLALLPFLLPVVARQRWWVVVPLRAVLVLAPLVAAVVLAAQHEQLAFEQEW